MAQECRNDTRDKLVSSFKQLVIGRGFDKLTVRDITDAAGVSRSTFYLYFKDKYDVIEYIFNREIGAAARPLIGMGYMREAFLRFIVQMQAEKQFYRRLYAVTGQNSLQEVLSKVFMEDVLRRMETHDVAAWAGTPLINNELAAEYLLNTFHFVIAWWLRQDLDDESGISVAMKAYDLVMSGAVSRLSDDKRTD